ncbi:unnamed protein product [Lepeophtheirus salmonis]|uniref:(salmon louse) hypothetical protein n=1 Tax=Lepeophtheirus salmonis TaxID=72036 RepID=A0A7R8CNM6_LEPSM|nr:unnamed protein product [Lepeophtheirus salmonis]CAF2876837.1 unnamed protein product [Lepeophtheirus salmonis]
MASGNTEKGKKFSCFVSSHRTDPIACRTRSSQFQTLKTWPEYSETKIPFGGEGGTHYPGKICPEHYFYDPRSKNAPHPGFHKRQSNISFKISKLTLRAPLDDTCGIENKPLVDSKIIGGQEAARNQFPWLAVVFTHGECTGSILDENWIITAKQHCIDLNGVANVRVGVIANMEV